METNRNHRANEMPRRATLFIACVTAAGLIALTAALSRWQSLDLAYYFSYLFLALVASTLKLRLPGMTGTISVSFLFILIGIADFSFSETMVMACAGVLVQAYWKPNHRPKPVQTAFNLGTLAISATAAYWIPRLALMAAGSASLIVLLALAASILFVANTALVATVVSLAEQKPYKKVWRACCLSAFPFYVAGAAVAALVSVASQTAGRASLLVLPVMYLVYMYYRIYLEQLAREMALAATAAQEGGTAQRPGEAG